MTYEWSRGTAFAEICKITDVAEGLIVRSIVRLDETIRDVRNAARVVLFSEVQLYFDFKRSIFSKFSKIGDSKLFKKMVAASELIKRDIVFAGLLF